MRVLSVDIDIGTKPTFSQYMDINIGRYGGIGIEIESSGRGRPRG